MKALGFVYRDNMFQFNETKEQCLQFSVSIQKNSYADSYKVDPALLIRSPFVEAARQLLFLQANLRRDGIRLHVRTESWWPPESLPEALEALKRFAIPWFREWGQVACLAEKVEVAIHERKHLIDVFEPLTSGEEEAIARAWPRPADTERRVPARIFFYASILHYLAGNREMAVSRTKDWLARLRPDEETERSQAQAQLASLERIH